MANPFLTDKKGSIKDGVAPDYSVNRGSVVADRREDDQNPYTDEQPGANAAPSGRSADNLSWPPGYLDRAKNQSPEVIYMEGDTSGMGTKVQEIDTCSYGDDYDPTSPLRVRDVTSKWKVDTDHDGEVN